MAQVILSNRGLGRDTEVVETVQYSGASPGLIDGLIQIDFKIPVTLPSQPSGAWVYLTRPGYSQPFDARPDQYIGMKASPHVNCCAPHSCR
jgi:hypothetical protein